MSDPCSHRRRVPVHSNNRQLLSKTNIPSIDYIANARIKTLRQLHTGDYGFVVAENGTLMLGQEPN